MSLTLRQTVSSFPTNVNNTFTISIAATASGCTVIVALGTYQSVTAVTDNAGNTYERDAASLQAGAMSQVFRKANATGGATSISVTCRGMTQMDAVVFEFAEILTVYFSDSFGGVIAPGNDVEGAGSPRVGLEIFQLANFVMNQGNSHGHDHPVTPAGTYAQLRSTQGATSLDCFYASFPAGEPTARDLSFTCALTGVVFAAAHVMYIDTVLANFTATPLSGAAPLAVDFTDSSRGTPTAWHWVFGDGSESFVQNPSHSYAEGTWSPTLFVANPQSAGNLTRTDYITVGAGGGGNGPPTEPGIPTTRGPDAFSPFGPLRELPGSMPFIMSRQPPPLITASTPPTAAPNVQLISVAPGATQARTERATRQMAAIQDALVRQGYLPRSGQDSFQPKTGGFDFGRAPTSDDDSRIGAQAGAWWCDRSDENAVAVYICLSAEVGEAVWLEVATENSLGSAGGATGTFPGN